MLGKLFQKHTGWLRSLKAVYVVNNWLNRRRLAKNQAAYEKYGLQKSVLAPVGAKDFRGRQSDDLPWLDRPDALEKLAQHPDFQNFDSKMQEQARHFVEQGYLILENFFSENEVEKLNSEVADLLASGRADFNYTGRKIMGLTEISPLADQHFFKNERLLRLLSFLLGKPVVPFHSINFIRGSEQRPHSDSIHMTTEPQGYLIAAWIALEPCSTANGALIFYPKTHRLPFVSTEDYDSGNTFLTIGQDSNRRYEDKIEQILEEKGFSPQHFNARPGDVLIWHANLIHGGGAIASPELTRRSMVCHYFAEGVICYHEMSQRPAILPAV